MTDTPTPGRGDAVIVEVRDRVMIVRLNRSDARNALTDEIRTLLVPAVHAYFDTTEARCLLITGTDKAFCAGGDLRAFAEGQSAAKARARMQAAHRWVSRLLTGEKPVVVAVNGPAVGAGFGLAMLGDLVLASESAFFQPGFSLVGLVPDYALGLTLPRLVGTGRAKEILFTNRRVDSAEALALGMTIARVPDEELFERAFEAALRLAEAPSLAIGLTRGLVRQGFDLSVDAYLDQEAHAQAQAFASDDHAEGVEAFRARRAPRFHGR